MDEDFLLSTQTAQKLYHEHAEKTPILDYHCHINPEEIAKDRQFENITQVWLGGDHYKWRQMRSNGVDEKYITGDAPDREKFQSGDIGESDRQSALSLEPSGTETVFRLRRMSERRDRGGSMESVQ